MTRIHAMRRRLKTVGGKIGLTMPLRLGMRRRRSLWRVAWYLLPIAMLVGCAQVPTKEFRTYRDTFNATHEAAREVILDYGAAKAEFASREAEIKNPGAPLAKSSGPANGSTVGANSAPAYPGSFTSTMLRTKPAEDAVEVRLNALETIHRYNEILADLAEGRSASELAVGAKSLVAAIESFTQPIPGLSGFASGLLTAVEKERSRAEFVKAVKAGEQPVSAIVDFLASESSDYYKLRWLLSERARGQVRERISNRIAASEKLVASKKVAAADEEDIKTLKEQFDAELVRIGGLSDRREGVKFEAARNAAALDAVDVSELQKNLGEVRKEVGEHQAVVSRMNTYYALLQNYDRLLSETRQSMRSLRLALDAPVDVATQLEELYRTAMALRSDLTKLRTSF